MMKTKKLPCWVCNKRKANTLKCDCERGGACPLRVCRACVFKTRTSKDEKEEARPDVRRSGCGHH